MKGICWLCGNYEELERHHIFPGRALRPLSEKYNATVDLCPWCHRIDRDAVHNSRETRKIVQDYGQRKVMREQGWTAEQFLAVFGKNYLSRADFCGSLEAGSADATFGGNQFPPNDPLPASGGDGETEQTVTLGFCLLDEPAALPF